MTVTPVVSRLCRLLFLIVSVLIHCCFARRVSYNYRGVSSLPPEVCECNCASSGSIPGVFTCVWRTYICDARRILVGLIGLVDVWIVSWWVVSRSSVLILNIFGSAHNASIWRPLCFTLLCCRRWIACSKSVVILFTSSIYVSLGTLQCSG